MRVGIGYDVHRIVKGRRLVLGGVEIPSETGLDGHSDADVLVHAVCDAILGAAALGDIGEHFPDTDASTEGISSLAILEFVCKMLTDRKYRVVNIDAVVIAQKPKIGPYAAGMRRAMAEVIGIGENEVGVKATTTERLGFAGREEGIAAQAVALIEKVV